MRERLQSICSPVKVSCFGDFFLGGGGWMQIQCLFICRAGRRRGRGNPAEVNGKNRGRSTEPVFWVASDRNWMDDKEL